VPVGRKVFLAVVLSQLFSIALIFGWYFYTLRSELGSLTRQRAQDAVLQSIAATEEARAQQTGRVYRGALVFTTSPVAEMVGAERTPPGQTTDARDKELPVPRSYGCYVVELYNTARTHRSLDNDAPVSRPVQRIGRIVSHALVGGLHHQYARI
jgi:hypothetical protein